jgi:hypothetical protein
MIWFARLVALCQPRLHRMPPNLYLASGRTRLDGTFAVLYLRTACALWLRFSRRWSARIRAVFLFEGAILLRRDLITV